ncbi:MAG: MoaD/ThiS family protein [Chitinophagaceae bacterium]|nr:MoaD/ThiS family protein [Chitinophagaceae bacterium]
MLVLTFGIVKEITGHSPLNLFVPNDATVCDLRKGLVEKYPELLTLKSLAIAVNGIYAGDEVVLNPGDEVALIPPVSGG